MTVSLPDVAEVDDAVHRLGLGVSSPELHGALCGWIAGAGSGAASDWLSKVLADDAAATPEPGSTLDRLRKASVSQFEDRDFGFQLLVAEADTSLAERSGALFDWCRGFLGGFGLAAGQDPPLSDEGREALADLARLAAAQAQEEGDQDDEDALVEIEEFVRVAALLLHGDCAMAPKHRNRLN